MTGHQFVSSRRPVATDPLDCCARCGQPGDAHTVDGDGRLLGSVLDEIQARAEAASPAPWNAPAEPARVIWSGVKKVVVYSFPADGEFISHAREDVPRLVAALRDVYEQSEPDGRIRALIGQHLTEEP